LALQFYPPFEDNLKFDGLPIDGEHCSNPVLISPDITQLSQERLTWLQKSVDSICARQQLAEVSIVGQIRQQEIDVNRLTVLIETKCDNRSATEQATLLFEQRSIQAAENLCNALVKWPLKHGCQCPQTPHVTH
jgi:hypothetical protein